MENLWEFDMAILEELKTLNNIPVKSFNSRVQKIMKKKSKGELWWQDDVVEKWDSKNGKWKKTNYRCCPIDSNSKHIFCLIIKGNNKRITVTDGFLYRIY